MKTNYPVVILDPGHGGFDPKTGKYVTLGKRSHHPVDGQVFYEGVNNRLVAKEWGNILRNHGFQVDFTIPPSRYQDMPLQERVKYANDLHEAELNGCIFISIHSNAAANPKAHGHEVFTSPEETKSDDLAQQWHEMMEYYYPEIHKRTDQTDGDADKEAYFYVLTKTKCPAILIELGFHTHDDDVRLMRNWKFRLKTGMALARAIKKWAEK